MRILVNNIKSTNSTLLVKQLKKIKKFPVEVWGTDVSTPGYIASSNFVDRYFQAPNINNDTEYLQFINKLSKKYKIDYLFVSSDKEVRFLDRHKNGIPIPFNNCPSDTIQLFQDKLLASKEIEKLGIKIPTIYDSLFGKAFCSQIIKHNQLIQLCKKIYSNHVIPGLSNVEFIENQDGIFFIEINLRIGGSASEGIIASFNYIEQYLDHFVNGTSLESLETYMDCVAWNSIVSRYYEEVLYNK